MVPEIARPVVERTMQELSSDIGTPRRIRARIYLIRCFMDGMDPFGQLQNSTEVLRDMWDDLGGEHQHVQALALMINTLSLTVNGTARGFFNMEVVRRRTHALLYHLIGEDRSSLQDLDIFERRRSEEEREQHIERTTDRDARQDEEFMAQEREERNEEQQEALDEQQVEELNDQDESKENEI